MENVTLLAAFVAGVLSFVSPCVLPLIPGYLSFVSGVTLDEVRGKTTGSAAASPARPVRARVVATACAFVVGFSLVFISLGATASAIGQFLMERLTLLGKIAGIVIIIFGLHTMGVLRLGWLYTEKRVQMSRKPATLAGAVLVGVAFAFGWTPCIGPILAGILAIAGSQETIGQGVRLLTAYSLGLGVPFLATALMIDRFFIAFARIRRYYHAIEITSGALLVVIGVLIFTNRFAIIAGFLSPYLPTF
ncbi:MAG: cytochrome c biogenesis protein CcdA [Acidobacteria bacterium]|nr:cytochrome c biogenesis protein CcdA [Acidobacteriota bacterium]